LTQIQVYLVGAGPGDPKLLTLRALEIINTADVIIYDRLVSRQIIDLISNKVELIYVGKDRTDESYSQDDINKIMISKAKEDKIVVRLKGGDPLLFSRGVEEIYALKSEGIKFEVVPGISSAFAVPSYAGIPLTHREISSSIAIVTGHTDPKKKEPQVKWSKLASSVDTIIILMGIENIKLIAEKLIAGGMKKNTPIASIFHGTTDLQKTNIFTLNDVISNNIRDKLEAPSIIIIGNIVKFIYANK